MDEYTFYHIPRTSGKSFTRATGITSTLHFPPSFAQTPRAKAITVLRNPSDRHFSEWLSYGQTLLGQYGRILCPEYVDSLAQGGVVDQATFVASPLTQNSQAKFLLGRQLYTSGEVSEADLAPLFARIEAGTLLPCVFEQLPTEYTSPDPNSRRGYMMRFMGGPMGARTNSSRGPSPIPIEANAVDQLLYDTVTTKYAAQVAAAHATLLAWMSLRSPPDPADPTASA